VNPVDDVTFTRPLAKALHRHVAAFAKTVDADAAVAWVYSTVLVAWAEQHGLIHPWLTSAADYVPDEPDAMRQWLTHAVKSLTAHPATTCLGSPLFNPMWTAEPANNACRDLVTWWVKDAPPLAYESTTGPASITGWLVGDLLQALSDDRRARHALVQTPWWIVDGILDLTLVRAAQEHRDEPLSTIDPCCGTGHFLIRKVDYLWQLYTTGELPARQMKVTGADGWTPVPPSVAIDWIVAGITGVELDPLTAAVARLRMLVTVGDLMRRAGLIDGPLRLDRIPQTVRPRIAVGDSLLNLDPNTAEYAQLHPRVAAIYGWTGRSATATAEGKTPRSVQLDLFGGAA